MTATKTATMPEISFEPVAPKGALVATASATPAKPARRGKQPTSILQLIAEAARDPRVDIDKMERLIAMQKDMQAQAAEAEFDAAMTAAQEEMEPIRADAFNKHTKSNYASYFALDQAIREIYTRHGFSLSWRTGKDGPPNHVRVVCRLAHRSGHREWPHIDMPADGKGAQGGDVMTKTHATGSAFTYGKRYLLGGIFNIAIERDDDGNAASGVEKDEAGRPHFRPERRGNFQGRSWTDDDPHLVDKSRPKGAMPRAERGQHQASTGSDHAKFIGAGRELIKNATTKAELSDWWRQNEEAREAAASAMPRDYDALIISFDERMTDLTGGR